jgi:hypothetical protein
MDNKGCPCRADLNRFIWRFGRLQAVDLPLDSARDLPAAAGREMGEERCA